MTFQSDSFPPLTDLSEAFLCPQVGHVGTPSNKTRKYRRSERQYNLSDSKSTRQHRWEDDGGAVVDADARISPLQGHLDTAERLLSDRDYNAAVAEYKHAAARFEDYQAKIKSSIDQALRQLSALGCRATPPHPKAIDLVRLQKQIQA
jgi:hypothetical protein